MQRGRIVSKATSIQIALGDLIVRGGGELNRSETMGARIKSFRKLDLSPHMSMGHQNRLVHVLQTLKDFRNRIDHDDWQTLFPKKHNSLEDVQGFGEEHLIVTNLDSLELLADTFEWVASNCELLAGYFPGGGRDSRNWELNLERRVSEAESAIQELDSKRNSYWKWRVLTHDSNFEDI